jgi:hypothetical protein
MRAAPLRPFSPDSALRRGLLLLACAAAGVAQATDSSVEWSFGAPQTMALGLGAGDPTYHGLGSCSQLSGSATATRYDTVVVTNNGPRTGLLDVSTAAFAGGPFTCSAGMDTVLSVYRGGFDPNAPLNGCIAHNDNANGGVCSRLSGIPVAPGASVTVVVAGAGNSNVFPYDLRFDGSVYGTSVYLASFEESERFNGRGMAATGQFTVDGYPAPLAPGSRLNGGVADGVLQGRLALAPAQLQDIATGIGFITLRTQLWQNGTGGGTLSGGNATLAANDLFLRLQYATVNGSPLDLGGNCQFGPIAWNLAGNADAQDIDLAQASYTIPPGSPTACNGLGAQLNSVLAGSDNSVTLSLAR